MCIEFVGTEKPETPIIGQVTGMIYPFNRQAAMRIDSRDAVYLLGPEFDLC